MTEYEDPAVFGNDASATTADALPAAGKDLSGHREKTIRRVLLAVIALLVIALIALLVMLLGYLGRSQLTAPAQAGIKPLQVILGPGTGAEPFFKRPMAAAYGVNDQIYVADTGNNRIVVFGSNGNYLFEFGGFGVAKPAPGGKASWSPGKFNYPTDVATDDKGNVYVADFRNDQIQVFDPQGKFLRMFPDRDKRLGKGASGQDGTGIAVTSLTVQGKRVYATDAYQVVVFSTGGELLEQFGKPGTAEGDFDHPNGIGVGTDDLVFVANSNRNRVLAMMPSGKLVWSFGKPLGSELSQGQSELQLPRGLVVADDGDVFVTDALADAIVRISATGQLKGRFGERGGSPGELNVPIDVDISGDRLLVTEKGGNRVQVVRIEE